MQFPRRAAVALLALAAAAPGALLAQQAWPTHPIKLIVPFPPGGTGDLLGRFAAKEMQAALGQPVVVENKAGAGGLIGSDAAAKAAPDGYTLVLSNIASHAIGPAVYPKMPYDAVKDFTHIGLIAAVPSGIAVSANGPYKTMADLLAKARTGPGVVRFGSNGNGTSSHVQLVLLNRAAKVDITHVPYKGAAPATADLIGGQVDGLIAAVPDVGRNTMLRLVAITSETRAARWPDVPTVKELGLAPVTATNWFGISGPAGIPADVADRLNAALVRALNTPELAERLRDMGTEPNKMNRAEYSTMVSTDVARWAEVARSANIHVE
ncbi:tripartite tricarboxylate transporter substrate binding protein [Ramlibacter sp. G-1-2-2]|uniref:Tripartite tricarboxylate transporter substrate binding protein n=1 Tax=Ramlibacter agri TaxID=2728837 RepID=A0A848HLW7_9BURK|nr:tripartite tricarboxylate transporter substrate binding protein [Ramlibacter agri]NML48748.1 tripartite tricarboxylate transporter substrate binding protein [Ramlibacter agri]